MRRVILCNTIGPSRLKLRHLKAIFFGLNYSHFERVSPLAFNDMSNLQFEHLIKRKKSKYICAPLNTGRIIICTYHINSSNITKSRDSSTKTKKHVCFCSCRSCIFQVKHLKVVTPLFDYWAPRLE